MVATRVSNVELVTMAAERPSKVMIREHITHKGGAQLMDDPGMQELYEQTIRTSLSDGSMIHF